MIGGLILIALGILGFMGVTPWIILPFAAALLTICTIGVRSYDRRFFVMNGLRMALTVVAYGIGVWVQSVV
jgi:hypothetical protein